MRQFFNRIVGNWWVAAGCGWPYPDGYCVYNRYSRTHMDHGITRDQAKAIAAEMNRQQPLAPMLKTIVVSGLLLVPLLLLSGCIFTRPVYTESRRPIIPLPEMKQLNEIPNELPAERPAAENAYNTATLNVVRLIEYIEALEAVVKKYNDESHKQNVKNGYELPPEPAKP